MDYRIGSYEPPSQSSEEWIEDIFTIIIPDTKNIVWKNDEYIVDRLYRENRITERNSILDNLALKK